MSTAWSSHPPPGAQECGLPARQPAAPKGSVCMWLGEKEGAGPRSDAAERPRKVTWSNSYMVIQGKDELPMPPSLWWAT